MVKDQSDSCREFLQKRMFATGKAHDIGRGFYGGLEKVLELVLGANCLQ